MMRLIQIFIPMVAGLFIFSAPAMAQTVPEHGVFVLNSLLFLMLLLDFAAGFAAFWAAAIGFNCPLQFAPYVALTTSIVAPV